jgi:hypothetical protein
LLKRGKQDFTYQREEFSMARKVLPSIYGEKIQELNISNIMESVIEKCSDPDWYFKLLPNWEDKVQDTLKNLDFWNYDYVTNYGFGWSGILTLEPFNTLTNKFGEEEDILNLIKDEHLKLVQTENGLILRFHNPVKSPLYRFFNKHKQDGYGGNIPYSINALLSKIGKYLEKEFLYNFSSYGEWHEYEYENEEIA